jgi:hypothetical protein
LEERKREVVAKLWKINDQDEELRGFEIKAIGAIEESGSGS